MKKISVFSVVLLMAMFLFNQPFVKAQSDEELKETTNFMKFSGVIQNIVKTDGKITLTVETEEKEPIVTIFTITEDTLLFDTGTIKSVEKESFKKGQKIDAYYDKNKPMILIYPAQVTPELVIVHDEKNSGFAKVGLFNAELVGLDNQLQLNISKETILVNEQGKKIKKQDLTGKELVVFYTTSTRSIPAQITPNKIVAINYPILELETTNYKKHSGIIKDIVKKDNTIKLTVETEEKEPQTTIFTIQDEVMLFNSRTAKDVKKEAFQKGQKIDAYYDKNKPRILVYPAIITPEIVVIHEKDVFGFIKVSKFDDGFVSLDKELKLNISKETTLLDETRKKITQKDLAGKELVVFYTFTKRSVESLPDQTTPTKIIAIEYVTPKMKEVLQIIEKDHFIKNGVKMIPLQKVAEKMGYEIKYKPKSKVVLVTLEDSLFKIKVGEKTYSNNRSKQQFSEKPIVKNNKTYVSEDFLGILLKQ